MMGPVVGEAWLPSENGFPGIFRGAEGLFVLFDFGGLCSSQRGVLLSFTISPSQCGRPGDWSVSLWGEGEMACAGLQNHQCRPLL